MRARLKIFFDGGCRGGAMEIAVVAAGHTTILTELGQGTSTEAEWLALIHAAEVARSLDAPDIVLLGDSADVVGKANGTIRCRGSCAHHLDRFRATAGGILGVRYIKRAQNLAGIALAARHPR